MDELSQTERKMGYSHEIFIHAVIWDMHDDLRNAIYNYILIQLLHNIDTYF